MQEKIKQIVNHPRVSIFGDTRVLGLLVFGVIAILVTWSSVGSIQQNYELQKQISELNQRNEIKKLENSNQKLRNEYYKTDQFLELAARRQFGKAAPGEKVYIVPRKVALANTVKLPELNPKIKTQADSRPSYQKNIEAWFNFFFHR